LMPDMALAKVKCRVCGLSFAGYAKDVHPVKGTYWVYLAFGPNLVAPGDRIAEDIIDGYKAYIVDSCSRKLQLVGIVPKKVGLAASQTTCCNPGWYSLAAAGRLPAKASRFMIVPYRGSFELPAGVVTATFEDKTSGKAEMIKGDLIVSVRDAEAAMADPAFEAALRASIACALPDLDGSMARIARTRRWDQRPPRDRRRRRLNGNHSDGEPLEELVMVEYEILIPDGVDTVSLDTVTSALQDAEIEQTLTDALREKLQELGSHLPVEVMDVSVPTTRMIVQNTLVDGALWQRSRFSLALVTATIALWTPTL